MKRRLQSFLSRLAYALCGILGGLLVAHLRSDGSKPAAFIPEKIVPRHPPDLLEKSMSRQPALQEVVVEKEDSGMNPDDGDDDGVQADPDFEASLPQRAADSVKKMGFFRSSGGNSYGSESSEGDPSYSGFLPAGGSSMRRRKAAASVQASNRSARRDSIEYRDAPGMRAVSPSNRSPERPFRPKNSKTRGSESASGKSAVRSPEDEPKHRARKETASVGMRAFSRLKTFLESGNWDGRRAGADKQSKAPVVNAGRVIPAAEKKAPARKTATHAGTAHSGAIHVRPPGMREALGKGVLRPPEGRPTPPDFSKLKKVSSADLQKGISIHSAQPVPNELEELKPPSPQMKADKTRVLPMGPGGWAVRNGDHWNLMMSAGGHWWTLAQNDQPLLWHAGHWWWKTRDGWFLLHGGEPWAFRQFHELKMEGLIHPASGTRVIYSSDGRRAAIIDPEGGSVVYDLETGKELGRWEKKQE